MSIFRNIAVQALPTAIVSAIDGPDSMQTLGATSIIALGQQRALHQATMQAVEKAAMPEAAGAIGKAVGAIAGRTAARYAVVGIPVAGEAIGAAMLSYDVFKLGYRGVTGQSFDNTAVGKAITRTENGAFHLAANGAAGIMDALGMRGAARFTRNDLSEFLTGSPSVSPAPNLNRPPSKNATLVLTPGPSKPINNNDWQEPPYKLNAASRTQTISTTPMGRAFATLNALTDDSGLARSDRANYLTPTPSKNPGLKLGQNAEKPLAPARTFEAAGLGFD